MFPCWSSFCTPAILKFEYLYVIGGMSYSLDDDFFVTLLSNSVIVKEMYVRAVAILFASVSWNCISRNMEYATT